MKERTLVNDTTGSLIAFVFLAALVLTGRWDIAVGLGLLALLLAAGYVWGWWERLLGELFPRFRRAWVPFAMWLSSRRAAKQMAESGRYELVLGFDERSGSPFIEHLQDLKSILVVGSTGFGKTTWLQSVLNWLVNNHSPDELQIAISDIKRTSFSIWGRIPHLFKPIARNAEETERLIFALHGEMERRIGLFEVYAHKRLCEDIDDYFRLSGVRLPRIVVIIDEKDGAIGAGTKADQRLISLAKRGRAYGITLILGTQRPSAAVLSGEIISQIVSVFCAYMPNSREYGVVTMIPPEMYKQMTATPGRFMAYTVKGQWRFMQGQYISKEKLESSAAKVSGNGRFRSWELEDEAMVLENRGSHLANLTEWRGSIGDKIAMVKAWAATLDERPKAVDLERRYRLSKPTALKFHKLVFGDE